MLRAEWVRESLGLLADARAPVFGAESHRFRLNPCLPEQDVVAFEERYGIRLPADYREFVTSVGNGGAGPYYGLFPLGCWDGERGGVEPWVQGKYPVGSLATPFPLVEKWNEPGSSPAVVDADRAVREDPLEGGYFFSLDGAMPICHEGCGHMIWLVLTGAEAGRLWYDSRVSDAGLGPVLLADGSRAAFSSWYGAWLEKAVGALPARTPWRARLRRGWRRLTPIRPPGVK